MIRFTCPHCQHQMNAKDDQAGKTGRCPKCQGAVTVPAPHRTPLPDTVKMTDAQRRELEERVKQKDSDKK
jgi:hypothetical protein